jgi:hypothetical protein
LLVDPAAVTLSSPEPPAPVSWITSGPFIQVSGDPWPSPTGGSNLLSSTVPPALQLTAVPEPASVVLGLVGLGLVLVGVVWKASAGQPSARVSR